MAQPGEWTADRVGALLPGASATLLRRMSAGLAVLGDRDEAPGCCLLVSDDPRAGQLTDLPRERRLRFFDDLDRLGEAVHNVCARRYPGLLSVDLVIHGHAGILHATVRPSYDHEPPTRHRLRAQLVDELDCICAAVRAEYPPRHVYGPDPHRRPPTRY